MQTLDEQRVETFVGHVATEVGAALNTALAAIGDRLGLYRAMADGQPVSAAELARRTDTHERYVREWLNAQAASGFVTYEPSSDRYTLPIEHAFVLADDTSPLALGGMFEAVDAVVKHSDRVEECFRTGGGVGWHEHAEGLFCGSERVFAASYRGQLVDGWLPALDGVTDKLTAGARVADVGCGHGASTILMAEAFAASTFVGFDYHAASIEIARARAEEAGVGDRVRFEVAGAAEYPGGGYDLVAFFDSLHDMGDPLGGARHALEALAPDGTCLIVEPFAADAIEDNLTPIGRYFYAISTLCCTPGALSQPGGFSLGTQAGERRLRDVLLAAGFSSVRRAAETPLNLILEARP
jgi:SAM-dependent methyltransferase